MKITNSVGVFNSTLANGTPVIVPVPNIMLPITVWVNPAAGDGILVEYRVSADSPWKPWPAGTVTAYTEDARTCPVSDLRFTRASGSSTNSTIGVA